MTACPDQTISLNSLLDGELDAVNVLAVENHLKTCAACNEEFQRLQALRAVVTGSGVAHTAPASLRDRIEASLGEAAAPMPISWVRRDRRALTAWATSATLGAMAAGFAAFIVLPQMAQAEMDRQLVGSHVRSLLANHLIDIQTSNQHVVRPWFNGKVDIAPPVPELSDEGFPLVGGRLDYIEGRVVPAIVYKRRLHTVNLFVWPDTAKTDGRERVVRRDGYSLVEWSQGGLRLSAVSDIEPGDLKIFQQAFSARAPK